MKQTLLPFTDPHMLKVITGSKTMTRRVVVPQPIGFTWNGRPYATLKDMMERCPYGQVGDEIVFRENLRSYTDRSQPDEPRRIAYSCNSEIIPASQWRWQRNVLPSRFMPRDLARYAVPIAELRLEHLQDIPRADVLREGIARAPDGTFEASPTFANFEGALEAFAALWDDVNGHRTDYARRNSIYSWRANPWVWVLGWDEKKVRRL